MIRPISLARRYRIPAWGDGGRLLASVIDNVQAGVAPKTGDTCVAGPVRDDPEFWGMMEQLRDLAPHVAGVQDLGHGNGQTASYGCGRVSAHKWLSQNGGWLPWGVS